MKRNLKKAFTIVELVIVIAVIAILAAVLIPTFVNVTKSAKENADTQLVRNLNTALASDTDEHPTMHSAIAAAEEFGYSLDKINAKASDNEILWDSVNDCFVYLKEGVVTYIPETKTAEVEDYQLWQITDEIPETQRFSIYAGSGFKTTDVTVSVGFDAGGNTAINSISYETSAEQTVVIRTNGGSVTVNAENSTVNHYGKGTVVDVQAVAAADCYHEYGTILGTVNLKRGTLYAEAGANISFIHITAESADAVKVVIAADSEYGYITAKTEELLSAVLTKVTSQSTVKSLVGEGEVAVVLNGEKTYAKSELSTAISDFAATEGALFELFTSIDSLYFNDTGETVDLVMPANGTILGHGYQISGAIAVYCNAAGGTVKGVEFYASYNNAQRTQEQIDRYGNATQGSLTSLYASKLSGKLTISDCIFDSADWDAIQTTPVKGAEIVITGNVFKHSASTMEQNRYIHVQSSYKVDFQITVTNNDFYDISSRLTEAALEIYFPLSKENISISGNYFDGIDITYAYTSSTFQSAHISCIGYGTSFQNYCDAAFNGAVTKPNR